MTGLAEKPFDRSSVLAILGEFNLGDTGEYTLATLPDPLTMARRTIWVTDLWSAITDPPKRGGRMVSEGGFWKPIRPLVTSPPINVATMTTAPFVTPTTLLLGNAGLLGLGVTMAVTLGFGSGFAVPYPGYRQRVVKPAGALGTLNIIGVAMKALTGWADYEFDGTAWQQTASGGLL